MKSRHNMSKAIDILRQLYHRDTLVRNINLDLCSEVTQKKVLVCYLDNNTAAQLLDRGTGHTNIKEFFQILQSLTQLHMVVDVCSWNYIFHNDLQDNYYDVILGFGSAFFSAATANPRAFKVLYMTENPYCISAKRVQERIDYLYERKSVRAKDIRTGVFYKEGDETRSDAILCVGEEAYYDRESHPVKRIYPSALKNELFKVEDIAQGKNQKKNFLVLASQGFVHKGMDLVMDVFERHKDWTLYYCGKGLKEECRNIRMHVPDNVVDCGFVNVESPQFYEIVTKCTYILHPSCSEGMSTSVMTGMMHGLIPIVTKRNGFDSLAEFCIFLEDYHIDAIDKALENTITQSADEIEEQRLKVFTFANTTFSLKKYTSNFLSTWQELLREGGVL